MDAFAVADARQRLTRWIEDGQTVLGVMPWLFDENERLRIENEAAARECVRLQQELDALRAETDFLIGERGEVAELIAAGLNKVMNDALTRLRSPFGRSADRDAGSVERILQPQPTYS